MGGGGGSFRQYEISISSLQLTERPSCVCQVLSLDIFSDDKLRISCYFFGV